jgi:hypothetical protein
MSKPSLLQAVECGVYSMFAALVRSTAKRLLGNVVYKDTLLSPYAVSHGQTSKTHFTSSGLAFSFSKFAANCCLCSMQAGNILQVHIGL